MLILRFIYFVLWRKSMQTDPFDDMRNEMRTRKTSAKTYPRPVLDILNEGFADYARRPRFVDAINTDAVANQNKNCI